MNLDNNLKVFSMSTKEQSVTLLRRNKLAQVEAFNAIGMPDVTEETRASEFAKRIKWAGGLLDLCLACQRVSDGSKWFFTKEEWESMDNTLRRQFLKRGLRVRAYGHSFVLAAYDASDSNGNITMTWSNNADVTALVNRVRGTAYNDFAGAENTRLILSATNLTSCLAATAASEYKAYTEASDGLDDTSDWHLPGLGVLITIYRCLTEIQEALVYFWSSEACLSTATVNPYYWSSTEHSNSAVHSVSFLYGYMTSESKTKTYRVRAVCEEV